MADVKRFQTPKRRLVFERHSLDKNNKRHEKCIKNHYFNHSVSLIIPGCTLESITKQLQYNTPLLDDFCAAVLPIHVFIDKEFIDQFIKQGEFYAISSRTHIDTGNCVTVLPTGILLLSLDKDTYEELGLTGKHSIFQKELRFIIEIDLKSDSFQAGKKNYDRVQWCFTKGLQLEFEFMFSWIDQDHKSNPESLQSYFSSYKCSTVRNRENFTSFKNLRTPVINPARSIKPTDEDASGCDISGFYEWLGCVQCDIDCSAGTPDSYTSTLTCPDPCVVSKEVVKCQWTGYITPQRILMLLETARSLLQNSYNTCPWIALNVWGFTDSTVSWLRNEHGFSKGGENMYTMVILPDNQYWYYSALGTNDICS